MEFFRPKSKHDLPYSHKIMSMEAPSGQNHDNKIAVQVNFNPTAANIMDLLHILSSINNTFFSVLVIILAT